jgi:DNA modification methylase
MEINTVYEGDCLEVMPKIPDKSVDMILCDLPYGTTACKWDVVIPFDKLWEQYKRIIKSNGAIVLFGSEPFSSYLRLSNIKQYKYDWYWHRDRASNHMNAKKQPMRNIETISVFNCSQYNPIMEYWGDPSHSVGKAKGKVSKCATTGNFNQMTGNTEINIKYPRTLRYFAIPHPRIHPTEKPVALFEYLIKTYTNEGELVLDNCAGSGTTAEACLRTNRNYILIEKEHKYVDIARERIQQFKNSQTNSLFSL